MFEVHAAEFCIDATVIRSQIHYLQIMVGILCSATASTSAVDPISTQSIGPPDLDSFPVSLSLPPCQWYVR